MKESFPGDSRTCTTVRYPLSAAKILPIKFFDLLPQFTENRIPIEDKIPLFLCTIFLDDRHMD